NPQTSRKVVLEGNRSVPSAPSAALDIKIDKVSVEEMSGGGLKEVDLTTKTLALSILDKLGRSLAQEDASMHAPAGTTPSSPTPSPSTTPPGSPPPAASTASKPRTPTSTADVVKRKVQVD